MMILMRGAGFDSAVIFSAMKISNAEDKRGKGGCQIFSLSPVTTRSTGPLSLLSVAWVNGPLTRVGCKPKLRRMASATDRTAAREVSDMERAFVRARSLVSSNPSLLMLVDELRSTL